MEGMDRAGGCHSVEMTKERLLLVTLALAWLETVSERTGFEAPIALPMYLAWQGLCQKLTMTFQGVRMYKVIVLSAAAH
jgi:hypothetical protein